MLGFGGGVAGIKAEDLKSDDRIVGDKKELTEEDLKPPPPPPAPAFGGSIFGGSGGITYPAFSFGASHFSFGAPVFHPPPPPPPKPKEYGVDYI